jgi:hypothetical protein
LASLRGPGAAAGQDAGANRASRLELGASAGIGPWPLRLAAGDLALDRAHAGLVGETAGLTRRAGTANAPWFDRSAVEEALAARPALGSAVDLTGWTLERAAWWSVSGGTLRRREGRGLAVSAGARRWGAQAAVVQTAAGDAWYGGGFAVLERTRGPGRERRVVAETAVGPAGASGRVTAAARDGPLRAELLWRHEAGRDRAETLDLESSWSAREGAVRFRWRSWSGQPSRSARGLDDGRAELDLRAGRGGAGAWLLRAGSRPERPDGGGERYALAELVVARERGRSLRLTAGARRVQGERGWREGRSLGAGLQLESGPRGSLSLALEAVRADGGSGAYGRAFAVDEAGSLRARTRSGIRAAARGWVRFFGARFGCAVDDEEYGTTEDEPGEATREPRVNVWMEWGVTRSGGADGR